MDSEQLVTVEVINNFESPVYESTTQLEHVEDVEEPDVSYQATIVVQPEGIVSNEQVCCCHCNLLLQLQDQVKLNSTLPQIDQHFSLSLAFREFGYTKYKANDCICKECLELLVTSIQLKRELEKVEGKLRLKCATVQTTDELSETPKDDEFSVQEHDKVAPKKEKEQGGAQGLTVSNTESQPGAEIANKSIGSTEKQIEASDQHDTGEKSPQKQCKRGRKKKTQTDSQKDKETLRKKDKPKAQEDDEQEDSFPCKLCNRVFRYDLYLQKHIILKHKHGCVFCRETFKNEKELTTHRKIHRNEQLPYSCMQCGKKFRKCQYLDNHLHIHFETYRCEKCLKCFKDSHDLHTHYQRKKLHKLTEAKKEKLEKSDNLDIEIHIKLDNTSTRINNEENVDANEETIDEHQKSSTNYEDALKAKKESKDKQDAFGKTQDLAADVRNEEGVNTLASTLDITCDTDIGKSGMTSEDEVCNTDVSQVEPCNMDTSQNVDEDSDVEPRRQPTRRSKRSNKMAEAMLALIPKKRPRKILADDDVEKVESPKKSPMQTKFAKSARGPKRKLFGCSWCAKRFVNEELLKSHLEEHTFVCKFCHKEFSDGDSLADHEESHENEIHPYACPVCTKKFKVCSHLDRHMGYHTDKFSCHLCSKNFMDSYDLIRHGKSMHEIKAETSNLCNQCLQCFDSKQELKSHLKKHDETGTAYICRECGTKPKFTTMDELMEHLKTCEFYQASPYNQPHPSGVKTEGKRPFVCTVCEKTFAKYITLKQHLITHSEERKFKCHLCDKAFKRSHHLKDHINSHNQDRRFLCEKCPAAFLTKNALTMHMMIHNGVWRHHCKICQKKFRNVGGLKVHMRSHTGERPFICDQCGRSFISKQTLQFHLATHTGERKYACSLCYRTFTNPKVAKNHLHTHTDEKRYECDICHNFFKMPATLYKHKKKVHKVVSARSQQKALQDYVIILPADGGDASTQIYEYKKEDQLLHVAADATGIQTTEIQATEIHLVTGTE